MTQPTAGVAGWDGYGAPASNGGGGGGITDEVPAVYDLSGGVYTLRISMREDGSALDAIIIQRANLPPPASPGPAESGAATQYVRVSQPPQNQTATPGSTATFTVVAEASGGTLTYQWQSQAPNAAQFSNISGATGVSYTTPTATDAMNGTKYRVVVSNGTVSVNSASATLITDSTPPALTQVNGGAAGTSVALTFNEKLDKTSAETAGNYAINGLAISKATVDATGKIVVLSTAAQTANTAYTVTVNGVKDAAGNAQSNGTGSWTGATQIQGQVLVKLYRGFGGTAVNDLLNNSKYPNSPDEVFLWDIFSSGDNTGDVFGDNYGGEVSGFVHPPATGDYKFYIRSDDASRLELSTDDTAAGLRQVAAQGGCCNVFTDAPGTLSSQPIALEKGKKYYFRAYWKEGGGGDFIQVGWLGPNDGDINAADAVVPISTEFLSTGFSKAATVDITQQPANVTTAANSAATFTVGYAASSVLGTGAAVQWQRAAQGSSSFADIAGATGASYTLPFPTAADNGAQFRAVVSVTITDAALGTSVSKTSSAASLTVSGDTTPPTLVSVNGGVSKITAYFSEPLDSASAQAAANYKIAGVNVTGATVVSTPGEAGAVELTLTGVVPGQTYNLAVSGVKDAAGNTIAAASKSFEAFHIISTYEGGNVPPGSAIVGSANLKTSGSADGSGFLELTTNAGSLQGSLVYNDVLPGQDVARFTAVFKLFIGRGSGNPADGFSFNIASDIAADPAAPSSFGEEGTGSGLTVAFDTYDNGGGEAPAFSLKWGGSEFASKVVSKASMVNNRWVDVVISVDAAGNLTLQHDNIKIYDNEPIPGWSPISAAQVGIGARTGGELEVHWVDDLKVIFNADIALPQPPTVAITSPTADQSFPVGSTVTIAANANDPEGQIVKVEFFANGQKLGEDTTSPYSLTIPNVPAGVYLVSASVTDAQNITVKSAVVKAKVGNPDQILVVHANGGPNASDSALIEWLIGQGYDPVTRDANQSATEDATGKKLIITSSTVPSGDVADKFQTVAVPVFNWEAALQDNYRFTEDVDTVNRGVTGGQTQLEIVDPAHPIAGGLSGVVTIADAGVDVSWGFPVTEAKAVAKTTDGTGHVALYAYETGDTLLDGSKAAARRVHAFGGDNTYLGLNATGRQLWYNGINWALGKSGGTAGNPPSIAISRNGNQVTVSSSDGGTVQTSSTISPASWTNVGPAPQNVTIGNGNAFFRIVK